MKFRRRRLVFQRLVHAPFTDLSHQGHRPPRTLLLSMGRVVRRVVDEVDGAFGAVHQLVARRGQGGREAVGPRTRCGGGRLGGSPDAIILKGVIGDRRRGLGRAARDGGRSCGRGRSSRGIGDGRRLYAAYDASPKRRRSPSSRRTF